MSCRRLLCEFSAGLLTGEQERLVSKDQHEPRLIIVPVAVVYFAA